MVEVNGLDFKNLIAAATRYPNVGSFVDSENVVMSFSKEKLIASTFGVVLSRAFTPAKGEDVPLLAVDGRLLMPFAALCGQKNKVVLDVSESRAVFKRGNMEVKASLAKGELHAFKKPEGASIQVNDVIAKNLLYLSNIAMDDTSRPEVCCVLLQDGVAVACNQKSVAVLNCKEAKQRVALPLPLLKQLTKSDVIYAGTRETAIVSGAARYMMPSPSIAQEKFRYDAMIAYSQQKEKTLAVVDGHKLSNAIAECISCVGNIARTEVLIRLQFAGGRLELSAKNGGGEFQKVLPVEAKADGKLIVPMVEFSQASALFDGKPVTVAIGKNKETFLTFPDGWTMFSSWAKTK